MRLGGNRRRAGIAVVGRLRHGRRRRVGPLQATPLRGARRLVGGLVALRRGLHRGWRATRQQRGGGDWYLGAVTDETLLGTILLMFVGGG